MIAGRAAGRARARVVVDVQALLHNYATLCRLAAPARVMAVLKANAYGMGLEGVAAVLWDAGCREYVVARTDEAHRLRAVLCDATVYVWQGLAGASVDEYLEDDLIPVLGAPEQVRDWAALVPHAPAAVYLDTGITRLGLLPGELRDVWGVLRTLTVRMWFSHLCYLDEPEHAYTAVQLARFTSALAQRHAGGMSIAGSAGAWMPRAARLDAIRAASGLAGIMPQPLASALRPVVSAEARVLRVRAVAAGETIGYERSGRVTRDSIVATAGAGYGDGLPNMAGGEVAFGDERFPIVGDLTMDLVSFDITAARTPIAPGQWVTLFGGPIDLREFAQRAAWSVHEVLARLHPDVAREYR